MAKKEVLCGKDAALDRLALIGNIAQFVSFGPDIALPQRFSRINGYQPNHHFSSPGEAVACIFRHSPEGSVNIRSFSPGSPKGEPLIYGLRKEKDVLAALRKKAAENKITIVNETIDVNDGGVSGVMIGEVMEFSPGDTPKCVEKDGICRLPRDIGLRLLENVYGFRPALDFPPSSRVEFSIHPQRRGIHQNHTILWELEEINDPPGKPGEIWWPNNFSRMLGDKAFGLLIADAIGLPVPETIVISRNIAPFMFGRQTGTLEVWMRTCPEIPVPGKYSTCFGWCDPFKLIAEEELAFKNDPGFVPISSVLAQKSVHAEFAGSLSPREPDGSEPFIEGASGPGDRFMIAKTGPEALPGKVKQDVKKIYDIAFNELGPVEIEWVYDGSNAWALQLHRSEELLDSGILRCGEIIIYPGEPGDYLELSVSEGLDALRKRIPEAKARSQGIVLIGNVGITSHFGDLLRKAKIPAKIKRTKERQ
jgi:hypothetical protein